MHPYLTVLRIGEVDRPLGTYGLMVALGVFVACVGVVRSAARSGADVGLTIAGLAITVFTAFAGAYGLSAIVEVTRAASFAPLTERGGVVFFGAVPGIVLGAHLAQRWFRAPSLALLDLSIPYLAIGHALGRVGCFLGGCCYGAPSTWRWTTVYPHDTLSRHPSPIYEAFGLALLALAFAWIVPSRVGEGRRTLVYLGAYSALRLVIELSRGDPERGLLLGISTSQGIATLGLLSAIALLHAGPGVIARWFRGTPRA